MSGMVGRALPPLPGHRPNPSGSKKEKDVAAAKKEAALKDVDFFLPTGIMIVLPVNPMSTLMEIKEQLYKEARKYPLFTLLKDQGFYNFLGITNDGEREEFVNESWMLDDLDLFIPMLKLVERQGNQDEKLLNAEISNLIGRRLHDFDVMSAEVQDFRRNVLKVCESSVEERTSSDRSMVMYNYPPNLVALSGVNQIDGLELIEADVSYYSSDGKQLKTTLKVDLGSCPSEVVERAMQSRELKRAMGTLIPKKQILKVAGKEEYLLEDKALSCYKYIRQCIAKEKKAQLSIKSFLELVPLEKDQFIPPVFSQMSNSKSRSSLSNIVPVGKEKVSIWELNETYKVKIISAKNVNVAENQKVYVRSSIYHGSEPVCDAVVTSQGANSESASWNEILEFNIPVNEIPRAAKLCFVIFGATDQVMNRRGKRKRKDQTAYVAWVNTTVFDYEGKLQINKLSLYAWPIDSELEDSVHYMGSTVLNPGTNECLCVEIEIIPPKIPSNYPEGIPITYPSNDEIMGLAKEIGGVTIPANKFPPAMVKDLQRVVEQDPLAQLDEQDKELIWQMRNVCMSQFKNSLPKLLQSNAWNNRSDTSQMYFLLQKWQQLTPEVAMELLDYQYADISVRNFAVSCLEVLSDDKLLMYLLQLVQVLKFEPYLDCALGQFLLRRALKSKTIGHFFFWHLRSEMHLSTVSVRFGLMLEAYCRGCGAYMKELNKQYVALNKMKQATGSLQNMGKKKADDMLRFLSEPSFTDSMENITSSLDPSVHLKKLIVEKCKVMDSKMKPLWVVFQNQDSLGDDVLQIFKNGDDLRQDMLTLQMMTIMDNLWKELGLDLRMTPYGCLSTGDQVGMIEVVLDANTIAKIQIKGGGAKGAFDKKLLYLWLKEANPDSVAFEKAIQNFTYSCAGCCVATYVLGIGDRHSDNIMLRKNGQLVHIDFGHFLGNFKSKFGVKRERVPFVLTDDFIYIITKGGTKESKEFTNFKKLCEDAFLKMRDCGPLFLNLFTMMLSCGIPELRTRADISYIREALCLGDSKEVALENFRKKIAEAIKNAWSVSLNWYFHNVVH